MAEDSPEKVLRRVDDAMELLDKYELTYDHLWAAVREEFEGYTEDHFNSVRESKMEKFRAMIRERGVWMQMNVSAAKAFVEMINEDTPTIWSRSESLVHARATASYAEVYSSPSARSENPKQPASALASSENPKLPASPPAPPAAPSAAPLAASSSAPSEIPQPPTAFFSAPSEVSKPSATASAPLSAVVTAFQSAPQLAPQQPPVQQTSSQPFTLFQAAAPLPNLAFLQAATLHEESFYILGCSFYKKGMG